MIYSIGEGMVQLQSSFSPHNYHKGRSYQMAIIIVITQVERQWTAVYVSTVYIYLAIGQIKEYFQWKGDMSSSSKTPKSGSEESLIKGRIHEGDLCSPS
jgi:hypothetical protein